MSLEKSLDYLSWNTAAGAVLDVFRENQKNEDRPGSFKASADTWCLNDSLRRQIYERARDFWCQRTRLDISYFPLSVDAVARLYFRFRKRNEKEIEAFSREIESASRQGLFTSLDD